MALWNALSQWVDNESSRDDVEEDDKIPDLVLLEPIIDRLNAAVAEMHEEEVQKVMDS